MFELIHDLSTLAASAWSWVVAALVCAVLSLWGGWSNRGAVLLLFGSLFPALAVLNLIGLLWPPLDFSMRMAVGTLCIAVVLLFVGALVGALSLLQRTPLPRNSVVALLAIGNAPAILVVGWNILFLFLFGLAEFLTGS